MPHGTVKFFNVAKGFGFITSDESAKDVFVPATSVAAAGVTILKTGQRVSFETAADTKGPKAVDLKIIAPANPPAQPKPAAAPPPAREEVHKLTLYVDPDSDAANDVLAELRRAGHEPVVVDYMASPPSREELKRLSLLLRDSDQSLVRKYEHLFLELRLDDRFIGESEYWGAIFEHPSLINGPVVATPTRACICHSKNAVKAFLSAPASPGGAPAASKPKGLSPGLLRLISGGVALPPPPKAIAVEKPQPKAAAVAVTEVKKVGAAEMKKARAIEKPAPKPAIKPKAKTSSPVKAKPAPKKAVPKAVKKPAPKTKKR